MLLQTPVRLPSQPLESAEPVRLRRESSESRPELEPALAGARRRLASERAAVVQFGAVALGLARSQRPVDSVRAERASGADEDAADEDDSVENEADADEPARGATASAERPAADGIRASRRPGGGERADADGGGERLGAAGSDERSGTPGAALSETEHAQVEEMKRRDREVRTHEQAHKSAGGGHTGSIRLSYQMGPDGKRYAVEGSVPIDVSPVAGDPVATLRKMEVVHRAANAPASPSSADRAVAAQAQRVMQQARAQMAAERYAQARELIGNA